MARDENVRIFQDTEKRVKEDPGLQEAVKRSVAEQVLIPEMMEVTDLMPELPPVTMTTLLFSPTMIFLLKILIWFEYTASQGGCLY